MILANELQSSDKETFKFRLERLKEIKSLFLWKKECDLLLFGGFSTLFAISEILSAYINGNFLSCICLAQIFFEHTLSSTFCMQGEDEIAEANFAKILDESKTNKIITEDFAEKLDELRRIRNSYTHFHVGLGKRSLMKRMLDNSVVIDDLLIKDAWFAVKLISDFFEIQTS
ncbi:MAG: hypothetical protein K2N30_04855 [Clostridia bacterium]|nr:hypothetical protein [Clostridia bacterium]